MSPVKRSRRDRAAATRRKIIRAAHAEFLEKGFHGTTVAAIAKRARVASQTVYFVFHTKAELMTAVIDTAVLGEDDPTPPQETEWWKAAFAEPDAVEALRLFVRGSAPIYARASAVSAVLHAASLTDEDLAPLWRHHEDLREAAYRDVAGMLASKGRLRPALDVDAATDVLLTIFGDMSYYLMTVDRKWPAERFIEWLCDALPAMLFASD